jgi:hypothetical protein
MQRLDPLRMNGAFDEAPIARRERPLRLGFDKAACQFEDAKVGGDRRNHAAALPPAESVLEGWLQQRPESVLRREHDARRRLEAARSLEFVAMKTAYALQQNVDRAKIGDKDVGVDVEALFEGLRADGDHAAWGAPFGHRRQGGFDDFVHELAILGREAAVMKSRTSGVLK